jgi:hypothetical protein
MELNKIFSLTGTDNSFFVQVREGKEKDYLDENPIVRILYTLYGGGWVLPAGSNRII